MDKVVDLDVVLAKKLKDPAFRAAWEAIGPIEPKRNWRAFFRHTIRSRNFKLSEWAYYWRKFIMCE